MKFLQFPTLLMSACLACQADAAVNDVLPGDFFPLAAGTSTLGTYLYDRKSEGPYVKGHVPLDGQLDTRIVALRVGHFFEVGGQPLSLIAVVPWADASVAPAPLAAALGREARGMGDLRLGATQWLLTDRERGDYLAVSAMVSLPTGDYERDQIISIGEHRTKLTLSLGWLKNLSGQFALELTPELAWYGDNDHYLGNHTLSQQSTFALTGYLRYRATPNWQFHVGGQINRGGATRIDDVGQDNAPDNARLMLGTTFTTNDRKHQWIVRAAGDTSIENGFKNNSELLVRYLWMF